MCRLRAQIVYARIHEHTCILLIVVNRYMTLIALVLIFISCNKMRCTHCEI